MIKVRTRGPEPLDKLLRRFKKKCETEGLVKQMKRSSVYEKPSQIRRRKIRKKERKVSQASAEENL